MEKSKPQVIRQMGSCVVFTVSRGPCPRGMPEASRAAAVSQAAGRERLITAREILPAGLPRTLTRSGREPLPALCL